MAMNAKSALKILDNFYTYFPRKAETSPNQRKIK